MPEEMTNESKKKSSVVKYASDVLKESSVSAVTGILTTGSIKRKVFKSIIFLIFTIAFLYQVITFLSYVLEYPTVVNIDIYKPDEYIEPAYTLCNSQKMRRSKYCAKYPDHCISTDDEFCKENENYCEDTDIRVKNDHIKDVQPEDIFQLGHDILEMIPDTARIILSFQDEPVLRQRTHFNPRDLSLCITTKSIVNSKDDPPMIRRRHYFERAIHNPQRLVLNSHDSDMFDPNIPPGIYFSVHMPYEAVNPIETGHFLNPGMQYKITIKMKEEKLLPAPYKTNCMDYFELWKKNGKTGPRSQEMCRQKCVVDIVTRCMNCSLVMLLYPSEAETICPKNFTENITPECRDVEDEMEICIDACHEECLKIMYTVNVRSMKIPRNELWQDPDNYSSDNSRLIMIDLDVDDREVLRYEFSPKYQQVEAFSYIGGFIGIWLGISLVQITDFIESIFLIGRYLCKKGSCNCKSSSENV